MTEQLQQQIQVLLAVEPQTEAISRQVAFLERRLNALTQPSKFSSIISIQCLILCFYRCLKTLSMFICLLEE